MDIGERLKTLRMRMKKTLKEESIIFNVSLNTIYRWENNLNMPRKSVLKKLAEYYNVSVDWLIHGDIMNETNDYNVLIPEIEQSVNREILSMIRQLSAPKKHIILGYMQRICEEADQDDE